MKGEGALIKSNYNDIPQADTKDVHDVCDGESEGECIGFKVALLES